MYTHCHWLLLTKTGSDFRSAKALSGHVREWLVAVVRFGNRQRLVYLSSAVVGSSGARLSRHSQGTITGTCPLEILLHIIQHCMLWCMIFVSWWRLVYFLPKFYLYIKNCLIGRRNAGLRHTVKVRLWRKPVIGWTAQQTMLTYLRMTMSLTPGFQAHCFHSLFSAGPTKYAAPMIAKSSSMTPTNVFNIKIRILC